MSLQQAQQPVTSLPSDLTLLSRDLPSTDEISEILRQRYLNDLIYTNISPSVLVVLNPYGNNELENVKADYISEYKDTSNAKSNQWREPHIYQLINHAYLHMRRTSINQSVLFR